MAWAAAAPVHSGWLGESAWPAPSYSRGLHAPHLCGPYRQPVPQAAAVGAPPGSRPVGKGRRQSDLEGAPTEAAPLRVYCDLDGVLADFNAGCLQLFPEGGSVAEKIPTHTVTKLTREEESEMWRRVEAQSDFFLSLPWMPDGEELWKYISSTFAVPAPAILTGLPLGRAGQMASKQKEQWCRERLGEHTAVFCCGTRNKQKFSGPGCILVDDRGDLREAWEARGGAFVHHTSAAESIRQLRELLAAQASVHAGEGTASEGAGAAGGGGAAVTGGAAGAAAVGHRRVPLLAVCWASQTPAGCFRPNCRYMHVPISRHHRSWIQLWCFFWWNKRMLDDLDELADRVRGVYLAGGAGGGGAGGAADAAECAIEGSEDMDEESRAAFQRMFDTLLDSCELGMPLDFLRASPLAQRRAVWQRSAARLPPAATRALALVRDAARAAEGLGARCHPVVAGSMGLGVDIEGSDVDVVLCCPVEVEPTAALRALLAVLEADGVVTDLALIEATTPLLLFSFEGLSIDLTVNQMGSIRDALLFSYALRMESDSLVLGLRMLKTWLKRRQVPRMKQGGFPALVWMRMAVRFYQEHAAALGGRALGPAWVRDFLGWARAGLPSGQTSLTIRGEQIGSNSGPLAAGVPEATLLLMALELLALSDVAPILACEQCPEAEAHVNLCRIGSWGGELAAFYIRRGGEASESEVVLCRVHGVVGGPSSEVRACTCERCAGAAAGRCCTYVSRRSREWLIFAEAEDPSWLSAWAALRSAGIQKRRPAGGGPSAEDTPPADRRLLLHPYQLVGALGDGADAAQRFSTLQAMARSLEWLQPAEPVAPHFGRALFLAMRPLAPAGALPEAELPEAVPEAEAYALDPPRRALEQARARWLARRRLRAPRSLRALARVVAQERAYADGTEELRMAEAKLAAAASARAAAGLPGEDAATASTSGRTRSRRGSASDSERSFVASASSGDEFVDAEDAEEAEAAGGSAAGGGRRSAGPGAAPDAAPGDSAGAAPAAPPGADAAREEAPDWLSRLGDGRRQRRRSVGLADGGQPPAQTVVPAEPHASLNGEPARDLDGAAFGQGAPDEALAQVRVLLTKEAPGDVLGFACEAAPASSPRQRPRIASISERGLLGRHNLLAEPGRRIGEGSVILSVNGIAGDGEPLRQALETPGPVLLEVLVDPTREVDASGRRAWRRRSGPGPPGSGAAGAAVGAAPAWCRCLARGDGARCRCGLMDALGRGDEGRVGWRVPSAALRVGNLSAEVDEEMLYKLFSRTGAVETVRVVRDTRTWASEFHGYVNFRTFQEAQKALKTFKHAKLGGRHIDLSWSNRAKGVDGAVPIQPAAAPFEEAAWGGDGGDPWRSWSGPSQAAQDGDAGDPWRSWPGRPRGEAGGGAAAAAPGPRDPPPGAHAAHAAHAPPAGAGHRAGAPGGGGLGGVGPGGGPPPEPPRDRGRGRGHGRGRRF